MSCFGAVRQIGRATRSNIRLLGSMEASVAETNRGRAQDRARVAGGQKHEVAYESKRTGSSPSEVRQAVKTAGNSRKKVEAALGGKK